MKPFAFISYSRSDKDVAIDLLKRIEKYPYPKEWVEDGNRPDDDTFVRPVFLDLTDLTAQARNFSEELRKNLKEIDNPALKNQGQSYISFLE